MTPQTTAEKKSFSSVRSDVIAGFVVFLIALPLCIGISVASGAPATAGIIAAIIGGTVGAFVTGSKLSINGPASGLIVIVLACVEELGQGDMTAGYHALLACTVAAGMIQLALGFMRVGGLGLAFPKAVAHGMLAAIGLIIISKQIYPLLGITASGLSPITAYLQLPGRVLESNPELAIIGLTALSMMFLARRLSQTKLSVVPGPLLAVMVGVLFTFLFDLSHTHVFEFQSHVFHVGPENLLHVPSSIFAAIAFPNFENFLSFPYLKHTLLIALVASAESILSACAIDGLDPLKRSSDLDRELLGKGLCNMISGFVGGLPMIAEIVRSSANISNGAKSQLSNLTHGLFLLIFIAAFPTLLDLIPMASLSAILVFVGYQLAKPSHFLEAFHQSKVQGVVFTVTALSILCTDLLVGILIGAATEFVILAWQGKSVSLFKFIASIEESFDESPTIIRITSPLVFTNYLKLRKMLSSVYQTKSVILDLRDCAFVDNTSHAHLQRHQTEFATVGINFTLLQKGPSR